MKSSTRPWGVLVVAGLFAIIMLAAAIQGIPSLRATPMEPQPLPTMSEPEVTSIGLPTPEPQEPNPILGLIARVLLALLLGALAAGVIALLVLAMRSLAGAWRDRPLAARDGDDVGFDLSGAAESSQREVVVAVIQRGIAGALREISARPVPSDAIIAAWVGLEESATDAGVTRGASETPGEFAVRIIARRSPIAADAAELLRLYERVRFGGYAATESDRETARAALQRIEGEWR